MKASIFSVPDISLRVEGHNGTVISATNWLAPHMLYNLVGRVLRRPLGQQMLTSAPHELTSAPHELTVSLYVDHAGESAGCSWNMA